MSERFGKYELLRKLGAGGMAEVFLAAASAAEGLRKLVVIKKIHPAYARSHHFVGQFVSEAKIALGLNHPNIVQFFDFGRIGETYFLAMEHVEGLDLMAVMRAARLQKRRIPYGLAAYVCMQACMGLDYAHRKRDDFGEPLDIVHRDVSPQNILISFDGGVRVADFGIASARDTDEDEGTVKGKYAYMSPEQACGERVDRRSDIFSLGVVLFEMSLGRPLFGALKGKAAQDAVKRALVPRPRSLDEAFPAELEDIVLRALARDRETRYQTARDLQRALARFVHAQVDVHDAGALARLVNRIAPRGDDMLGDLAVADQPTQPPFPRAVALDDDEIALARAPGGREHKNVVLVAATVRGREAARREVGEGRARQLLLDFLSVAENVAFKHDSHIMRSDDGGLLMLLGAPISTEHDSARAVRLARAMIDALEAVYSDLASPPRLGVGIQRGSALMITNERAGEFELDVDPSTLERAELMAHEALPGEVLVGGGVFRLARREFAFELLREAGAAPSLHVDAISGRGDTPTGRTPKVYRLQGPLPRGARLPQGAVELVGRELELRRLAAAYAEVVSSRRARQVAILGHAGLGKRALAAAFLRSLEQENAEVVRAGARAAQSDMPYALLRDLLRDLLGIADDDQPREIRRIIDSAAAALSTGDDEQREAVRETLAALFAVDPAVAERPVESPSRRQRRVRSALRHLLIERARTRPLLVVTTDLHLADQQSLEVIAEALRGQLGPILGIATSRPGDAVRTLLRDVGAELIEIEELDAEQREQLVMRRLSDDPASRRLAREILERTGGNPLFISEMIGALEERGVLRPESDEEGAALAWVLRDAPLSVPTTVEGVVASRIDSLSPQEKTVLMRASVLGPQVPRALLERLAKVTSETVLERLGERGFLVADDSSGRRYSFVNDLTREVAYSALPEPERRRLHQRAAAQMAADAGYRPGSDDALVAWHLELAGDSEMALQSYLSAARYALARRADAEALRLFGRALRVLAPDQPAALEVHAQRERILAAWGRRRMQLREIRRLRRVAERVGDISWQARADTRLAELFTASGRARRALEPCASAIGLSRSIASSRLEADALRVLARARHALGDTAGALEALDDGLELSTADGDDDQAERSALLAARAALLSIKGELLGGSGELRRAMSAYAEALLIHHRQGDREGESATLSLLGKAAFFLGEVEEALAHYKRALKIARDAGDRGGVAQRLINIGHAYGELGDAQRALPYLGKALQINQALARYGSCASALTTIAQLHLKERNASAARPMLERAARFAEDSANLYERLRARVYLAHADLLQGDLEGACERAREVRALADDATMRGAAAHAASVEARALAALGDHGPARQLSDRVLEILDKHNVEGALELLWQRVELMRALGDEPSAAHALGLAGTLIDEQQQRLSSARWRERYLSSIPARYVIEALDAQRQR
ncbi:MAG: protein kinase [Myxococcales bacterium]|nr:protein kinase [Myxococcales bacterium]